MLFLLLIFVYICAEIMPACTYVDIYKNGETLIRNLYKSFCDFLSKTHLEYF